MKRAAPGLEDLKIRRFKIRQSFNLLLLTTISLIFTSFAQGKVVVREVGEKIVLSNNYLNIEYDLRKGKLDAFKANGELVIKGGYSGVLFNQKKIATSLDNYQYKFKIRDIKDRLGKGKEVKIFFSGLSDKPDIIIVLNLYEGKKFFTLLLRAKNSTSKELRIDKLFPLVVTAKQEGGIFLGKEVDKIVVLENGYDLYFDFYVRLISIKENSISNWNSAIYDLSSKKSFISGYLSNLSSLTRITTYYQEKESISNQGRKGISSWSSICEYEPAKTLLLEESLTSERLYINFLDKNPHLGLENFAKVVGKYNNVKLWKGEIPTGWNSWATLYHHNIDEKKMLENAHFVAKNLKPYGMTYFQIDDPWQITQGDWEANEHFPHGMKWILSEIKKMGLKPGLWIAPFVVDKNSSIYKHHQDWLAPKSVVARKIMPEDWEILDLSHPEVQKWLHNIFYKMGHEWGCKWIKTDFVYYALLGRRYYKKNITGVEAYRMGLKIIRDALPEDCFLLNVGVPLGASVGLVDGMRFALDNTSCWGDSDSPQAQGLKPMVRNVARRYYLNYNLWINHPDMFYLGSLEEEARWGSKLTLEEARCYASLVALTGGITKIGDTFVGLSEEQLNLLRRLLPVYPHSACPLDLFTSRYPQVWDLKVKKGFADWDVVGLFNWGQNKVEGKEIPEGPLDITVNFKDLGKDSDKEYLVFEFWSEEFLGEFREKITLPISPRRVKILTIHLKSPDNLPQFLSTNRHLTQGATDLKELSTKILPSKKVVCLKGSLSGVEGFPYNLTFYVPEEYKLKEAKINLPQFNTSREGKVLKFSFRADKCKLIKWELDFE